MGGFTGWIRAAVVVGGALTVTACSTYPSEPRYSTRPMPTGQGAYPAQPQPGAYPNNNPYYAPQPQPQTPPPARPYEEQGPRAPAGSIEDFSAAIRRRSASPSSAIRCTWPARAARPAITACMACGRIEK